MLKVLYIAAFPTPAKKENHGWVFIGWVHIFGAVDLHEQLGSIYFFIYQLLLRQTPRKYQHKKYKELEVFFF